MSSIWGKVSPSNSKGGSLSLAEYVQFSQLFSMCYGISLLFEKLSGGCPLQARVKDKRSCHGSVLGNVNGNKAKRGTRKVAEMKVVLWPAGTLWLGHSIFLLLLFSFFDLFVLFSGKFPQSNFTTLLLDFSFMYLFNFRRFSFP